MRKLLIVKPEIVNQSLSVAPILLDLYPTFEVDFAIEKFFHVLSRIG